jgi:hypothetical protein
LYSIGSGVTTVFLTTARTGFAACLMTERLVDARFVRREVLRLWLRPVRVVRVARMVFALT